MHINQIQRFVHLPSSLMCYRMSQGLVRKRSVLTSSLHLNAQNILD